MRRKLAAALMAFGIATLGMAAFLAVASPASADTNCSDYPNQAAAQARLRQDPSDPDGLDGPKGPNNDTTGTPGVACENNACPCDRTPVVYAAAQASTTVATIATTTTVAPVTTLATTATTTAVGAQNFAKTGAFSGRLFAIAVALLTVGWAVFRPAAGPWRVRSQGVAKVASAFDGFDPRMVNPPVDRRRSPR